MSSSADALRQAWRELGGEPSDDIADLLVERHAEPHRRYHTAEHVAWVLHHLRLVLASAEIGGCEPFDADAVRAAALFHDVVYEPASATNEADSAEIAVAALRGLGWEGPRLEHVRALILATETHIAVDGEAAVLLDADLAILGAGTDAYSAYVSGIRSEYSFVDDDGWRTGRARVLHSFLDRDRIYRTPTMATALELRARANLAAELARLISDERR